MDDFEMAKLVNKKEFKTDYGLVKVKNIELSPSMIENMLPKIVLEDENLKFMFQLNEFSSFEKECVLKRFIPEEEIINLDSYIEAIMVKYKTFYSFLAEGILTLIFRDLNHFDLVKGVIDLEDTLVDTHTGVDACMYDENRNILVLGEAKFYESFRKGMNEIIKDFTEKSMMNKLNSLKKKAELNRNSKSIIIKNLNLNNYRILSINEFLKQKLIFSGFVLHSWNDNIQSLINEELYTPFTINEEMIKKKIKTDVETDLTNIELEIIMYHLPIESKKQLIKKIIEKSLELLEQL